MALKESGSVQTEPMEGESLLARLNAFGERHAKVIIFVSVALLIATVLIFAKVLYDRSVLDRASKDIAAAYDSARLLELKARYAGTRAEPEILYRLANRYYEENKLDEARKHGDTLPPPPPLPPSLVKQVQKRYVEAYERLTGKSFPA